MSIDHDLNQGRLCRYYLNGVDAFRLKLLLPITQERQDQIVAEELKQLSLSNGGAETTDDSEHHQLEQQQEQDQQSQEVLEHSSQDQHQPTSVPQQDPDTELELLQRLDALRT